MLVVLGGVVGGGGGGGWRCGSFGVCFVCCDFICRCVYVFTFIGAPNPYSGEVSRRQMKNLVICRRQATETKNGSHTSGGAG